MLVDAADPAEKTLAAAVLAVIGSTAAFAQTGPSVTIYGLYDAATRHAGNVGPARESRTTMEDGIITGTRLGVRGREDLGGGLLAVFTLEAGIDPSTGLSLQASPTADYGQVASTTRFFGREAHVGLRIGAGGVTLGPSWAWAAYAQQLKNLTGTETRKILGAGGNVRLSERVALFGGVMQRTSDGSAQKNRAWTLGANIDVAPLATLSIAHFDDRRSGSAALDGSRRVSWVQVSYRLSRRTDVYAVLDQNRVEGGYAKPAFMGTKGTQTGSVLGLRHRF